MVREMEMAREKKKITKTSEAKKQEKGIKRVTETAVTAMVKAKEEKRTTRMGVVAAEPKIRD